MEIERVKDNTATNPVVPVTQAIPINATEAKQEAETITSGMNWEYSQNEDKMSSATTYHAHTVSTNTVNFDSPYSGEQHAALILRNSSRQGKDAMFQIERGQILCNSYEDCEVLVRFDDEKATKYSAIGPADNSTETIFIRNYSRFVEKMRKAKLVRISTNIYQQGAPIFEFNVSDFDQNRHKSKQQ